ncbi:pseudouridine-metabolizing bifunctional protein C1861.05-like [Lingula anatina]|uniref:Pseudouridine-metabolizing bifunctional protein C1861.05-like n=1 Tax=Lingula anatina TaxID=7574 RepID=A0A1S3HGP8_LINAN|nr:pseudouridine-metabolizing bifunctional protein C1861.05-like [Lingula anatina]|eukprot:XP_013384651.1 pseudouridine-metabolizing bifunctional protein C1861.05-like [Lingula anatina]
MRLLTLYRGACLLRNATTLRVQPQQRYLSHGLLQYSREVSQALQNDIPVVALESTIITHGIPFPQNIQIYSLDGDQLESLTKEGTSAVKTSRRDMAWVLSQGFTGGLTVAGTMIAAHKAGIQVFVTGGIGGVHRGAETSLDISADLTELGRTPITVVSSGVKSILDIERTLEYLETEGVCVAAYGPSTHFPSFFTPRSGHHAPHSVNSPAEAARMIYTSLQLELDSGVLIAVPIPEDDSVSHLEIEQDIQNAIIEAEHKNIKGKEVTPYLLKRVHEMTQGDSLRANMALIRNNADIGSKIAIELAKLQNQSSGHQRPTPQPRSAGSLHPAPSGGEQGRPVVIGGTIVDFTITATDPNLKEDGGSYPGHMRQSFGGVGRNLADGLARLGSNPFFISAIGTDGHAESMLNYCSHMDCSGIAQHETYSTATYCAILRHSGELMYGVGDMEIHSTITPEYIARYEAKLCQAPIVLIDGNIPESSMEYVCNVCDRNQVPVWFDPTDLHKAEKPFHSDAFTKITYTSPNINELRHMRRGLMGGTGEIETGQTDDLPLNALLEESVEICRQLIEYIPTILVTLGKHGILLCRNTSQDNPFPYKGKIVPSEGALTAMYCPAYAQGQQQVPLVSVSGAGDSMVAAIVHSLLRDIPAADCIKYGLLAATLSLQSHHAIIPSMHQKLQEHSIKDMNWQDSHLEI